MGYPKQLLSTRAIIKRGVYALIPQDGLVNNILPNITNAKVSIIASPKMGANFVEYIMNLKKGSKTIFSLAQEKNVESFLYVISGELSVCLENEKYLLKSGGYIYSPAGKGISFENECEATKILFYKKKYIAINDYKTEIIIGNVNEIEYKNYDEMENVYIKNLLPDNIGFDMNMHILAFKPGGCHPFIETHIQEHGAYVLSGEGMYYIENSWIPVKKDDFIWFGPYVQQGSYGVGREIFSYIYSKDCNRDVTL